MRLHKLLLAALVAAGTVPLVAMAVDGVVLIDQNRALIGNVTPGDGPGYPVTISAPGSYRLSGNLTVPAGMNGIEISASDVTIDLNGFRVTGGGGAGTAIRDTGTHQRISVSNGTLTDFGSGIMMLTSDHAVVRDVRTTNLSSVSIVAGQYALVQRNIAQGLIQANCPSVISENITEGFITVVLLGPSASQCVRWNNRALNFTGAVTQ